MGSPPTPLFTLHPKTRGPQQRPLLLDADTMDNCRSLSARRGRAMERTERTVTMTPRRVTLELPRSSSRLSDQSSVLSMSSAGSSAAFISPAVTVDTLDSVPLYTGYKGVRCPRCNCDRGALLCDCDSSDDDDDDDKHTPPPSSWRLSQSTSGLEDLVADSVPSNQEPDDPAPVNSSTLPRAKSTKLAVNVSLPRSKSTSQACRTWTSSLTRQVSGRRGNRGKQHIFNVLSQIFGCRTAKKGLLNTTLPATFSTSSSTSPTHQPPSGDKQVGNQYSSSRNMYKTVILKQKLKHVAKSVLIDDIIDFKYKIIEDYHIKLKHLLHRE